MPRARASSARWKSFASVFALALVYAAPLFTVFGEPELFFKLGTIKGEVLDKEFRDWSYASGLQHGVTRQYSSSKDGSLPEFGPFTISKRTDSTTPHLLSALTTAETNLLELELVRTSGIRQRFYKAKLHGAYPTDILFLSDGETPTESVSFSFRKMELTYTEFQKDTTTRRTETTAWYDLFTDESGLNVIDFSNTAPTISSIVGTSTGEDTPITVNFTVGDSQTPAGSLAVSAVSTTTPSLVPLQNITFGGSGANRTATITPVANQSGTTTLAFRVSDGSLTATSSFTLTVDPVNDAPTIAPIPGKVTEVNTPLTVNLQVNDVDTSLDSLTLSGQSSNDTLIPNGNISFGGTGANRSVTITPASGQIGDTTITLRVSDGALSNSVAFALSVIEHTPQTPTDILLSNNSVPENSTNGTLVGFLSAVDSDSTNHTFALLDPAGGRFALQGNQLRVNNGSLLNFEEASNYAILVKVTDSEGLQFSRNLSVQVLNVNEAPAFVVSDSSIIETVSGEDTPISILQLTDPDAGTNTLTLTLQVVNGVLNINSNFTGIVSSNGTGQVTLTGSVTNLNHVLASTNGLLYRATTNATGTDILTATINDNGYSGTGTPQIVYTTLGIHFYRTRYVQWLHGNFSEPELNDGALQATVWGPNADPDEDGLENLAEYGLGTEPREKDSRPSAGFTLKEGQRYLAIQVNRRLDPQLILSVEVANDASGPWSSAAADLETFPPMDLNNGFVMSRFDDRVATTESAHRFMRLRWTLLND